MINLLIGESLMKKLGIVAVLLFLLVSVSVVRAEVREGAFSLGLSAGGYVFEGNQDYKNNYTIGWRVGYNFTENIGAELFWNYVPSQFEDDSVDDTNRVYVTALEGIYHFNPKSDFVPFLAVGIGATHYTSSDDELVPSKLAVDYGAGFKYFMTDNLALRADVRHVLPVGDDDEQEYGDNPHSIHNDLMATMGISYSIGGVGARKASAPVVKEEIGDEDKDGVLDDADRCPGTAYGVEVDNTGCVADSDRDGVNDNRDQCPGTPANVSVNSEGCPADADRDGVADYMDKCPGTPADTEVQKDGCSYTPYSVALKVEFDTGKSDIKPKYHEELKTAAVFMQKHPESTVMIVGHTDNVGDPDDNVRLSQERANSIRAYLIDHFGVEFSRISATGVGAEKPIASNDTAEGRQQNRRIVAVFQTVLKK